MRTTVKPGARARVVMIQGANDADSEIQDSLFAKSPSSPRPLRLCSECGKPIERGAGRFNVCDRSYHVHCYDPDQHVSPSARAAGR